MQADCSKKKIIFGVDIGGTTTKLGVFKCGGEMLARHVFLTGTKEDGGVLKVVADKIREVLDRGSITADDVAGIGVGVPGIVTKGGVVVDCANIDLKEVYLQEEFSRLLPEIQALVRVGNNANAAALGEMYKGAGKGREDIVMVTVGTGLGAGIILNGQIVTGYHGSAGEIGHLMVNEDETVPCGCGHYGCLEQYIAAPGIVRAAQQLLREHPEIPSPLRSYSGGGAEEDLTLPVGIVPPPMTIEAVFDAAHNGDEIAEFVIGRASTMLGKALAFVADFAAPEVIILGGRVSRAGAIMLDSVKDSYKRFVYPALAGIPIRLAALGSDAGMIGCDYMIEQYLYGDKP